MPAYICKAVNRKGREIRQVIQAESESDAIAMIRARGLFPTEILAGGVGVQRKGLLARLAEISLTPGVKAADLVVFMRQFANLISAGVPLLRSLKVLQEQQRDPQLQRIVREIQAAVESGASLSEAMSRYPKVFPELFINMVKAGEAGGVLDTVLLRLAEYFEKSAKLKARIKAALVYPILVILAAIGVMLFLVAFIIPRFAEMFRDMNLELPALTRVLIALSEALMRWPFWVCSVGIVAGIVVLWRFLAATPAGRMQVDRLKLKLPVFGPIIHRVAIARFARTLGTLIASGVAILKALVIVRDTIGNAVFSKAINHVSESIREGESVAGPLQASGAFNAVVVHMISVGEETGKLDEVLLRIADQYDEEIDVHIGTLTTLLEPFLIVVLAVVVGLIVISLFLPLISLMSNLGQM